MMNCKIIVQIIITYYFLIYYKFFCLNFKYFLKKKKLVIFNNSIDVQNIAIKILYFTTSVNRI